MASLDTFGIDPNTLARSDRRSVDDEHRRTADHAARVMTYAFPKQVSRLHTRRRTIRIQNLLAGFAELAPDQKLAVRTSLDLVSSFTQLTFTEARPAWPTTRPFASSNTAGGTSFGSYPWRRQRGSATGAGDVFLGSDGNVPAQYFGTDGFFTIVHEIGHALGLKHGHETDDHGALAATATATNSRS